MIRALGIVLLAALGWSLPAQAQLITGTDAALGLGSLVNITPTGLASYSLNQFMADRYDVRMQATPAVCNGVTNDTAALNAATAPALLPITTCFTSGSAASLTSGHWFSPEGGYITSVESATNRKQSPNYSRITSAPTQTGGTDYIFTAFDADWSKVNFAMQTYVTGATTLGQPAATYQFSNLTAGFLGYYLNASGWNQGTGSATGRTGAAMIAGNVGTTSSALGDTGMIYGNIGCQGAKAAATDFLANPACSILFGQVIANSAGVYLQPIGDINCSDAGLDVACIGIVWNGARTNGTGALNTTWIGSRMQSKGAVAIDAFYSTVGLGYIGLDLVSPTYQSRAGVSSKAAVAIKANDRIYNDSTNADGDKFPQNVALGTEWYEYDATLGHSFVVASASVLSANATGVTTSKPVKAPQFNATGTKFTISGCTTSATVGGATAGEFVSGTTGACTPVITLGGQTAPNAWSCWVNNLTTANLMRQTARTTTTATFSGTTVSGDLLTFGCMAY